MVAADLPPAGTQVVSFNRPATNVADRGSGCYPWRNAEGD